MIDVNTLLLVSLYTSAVFLITIYLVLLVLIPTKSILLRSDTVFASILIFIIYPLFYTITMVQSPMEHKPLDANIQPVDSSVFCIEVRLFLGRLPVSLTFQEQELSEFIGSYLSSNTLPIDSRESRQLENFSFYNGRKHINSKCDYCASAGEHKLTGSLFRNQTIGIILCQDCFQELLDEFSEFIKSQSEEVVSQFI